MDSTALAGRHRRRRAGLRLHQRLPRLGQRDRHSVSTKALTPRVALAMAAVMNVVGALISTKVADDRRQRDHRPPPTGTRRAASSCWRRCVGAIVWNLGTWYFGLPSSSSHALIGGLVGAALAGVRGGQVARRRRQGRHPDGGLAADRLRPELPVHARAAVGLPEGATRCGPTAGSAGRRSSRPRRWRSGTARRTRRRRWASSR